MLRNWRSGLGLETKTYRAGPLMRVVIPLNPILKDKLCQNSFTTLTRVILQYWQTSPMQRQMRFGTRKLDFQETMFHRASRWLLIGTNIKTKFRTDQILRLSIRIFSWARRWNTDSNFASLIIGCPIQLTENCLRNGYPRIELRVGHAWHFISTIIDALWEATIPQ